MTLGETIRQARQAAGLSQRQLCGGKITRNMLSQIENGTARPSMDTLLYLAERLGKPVSFFLQEAVVESVNPALMQQCRQAYAQREYGQVLALLAGYQSPDPLFDQEKAYLHSLCALALGEQLLPEDPVAAEMLLSAIDRQCLYYRPEQEQTRRLLLRRAYSALEEMYRLRQDFEKAYFYACKQREW